MERLTIIGYWRSTVDSRERLPHPSELVDSAWDVDERELVVEYLLGGLPVIHMMGYSPCRICGENNGTSELTDGIYLWPSGLPHYLLEHSVRLPRDFVAHAVSRFEALETQAIATHDGDLSAWIAMTGG